MSVEGKEDPLTELRVLLARIDERTKSTGLQIEVIKTTLAGDYVTKAEMKSELARIESKSSLTNSIVYGMVGVIVLAVIGALVATVVSGGGPA